MSKAATATAIEKRARVEGGGRTPGEILYELRAQLHLTLRDVVAETRRIAESLDNEEFAISLSCLSDIEHKGVVPNIYRLYSLAEIYRIELKRLLFWFGIPKD